MSEDRLINEFEKVFGPGPPDKVVLGSGDWSERRHRKYHEPTKGKCFQNLFACKLDMWCFLWTSAERANVLITASRIKANANCSEVAETHGLGGDRQCRPSSDGGFSGVRTVGVCGTGI